MVDMISLPSSMVFSSLVDSLLPQPAIRPATIRTLSMIARNFFIFLFSFSLNLPLKYTEANNESIISRIIFTVKPFVKNNSENFPFYILDKLCNLDSF